MSRKKKLLIAFVIFIIFIQVLPFLIPLSTAESENPDTGFSNSRWISVDGVNLHYRTWSPESVEHDPIVYIHGLGGSTFSWRYNVEPFLQEGFPVIAVDLPAFGFSSRAPGLTHSQENRSQWVFGLLDILGREEPTFSSDSYHLVGHSMGGGVITAMALDNEEKIHTLTYVAGAVINDPPRFRSLLRYPPLTRSIGILGEYVFFNESRLQGVLASAYGEEIDQDVLQGYLTPLKLPGTGRVWGDLITSTTSFEEERIKEISIPSFLIWGEEDTWVPLEEGKRLEKLLNNARLRVIEGSGHTPMETHSEVFNNLLLDFLLEEERKDSGRE